MGALGVQERQDLYGKRDLERNTRICIYTTALRSQRVADWAVCGPPHCPQLLHPTLQVSQPLFSLPHAPPHRQYHQYCPPT